MPTPREPQDRKAPAARVRKSTKAEIDQTTALIAEVDTETAVAENNGFIAATLCGEEILVRPIGEWRQSTMDAVSQGRFNDWAETALDDDSYDRWVDLDPTFNEVSDFFDEFGKSSGGSLGDRKASAASLRSTRRR